MADEFKSSNNTQTQNLNGDEGAEQTNSGKGMEDITGAAVGAGKFSLQGLLLPAAIIIIIAMIGLLVYYRTQQ